jgi:hypothetical protein
MTMETYHWERKHLTEPPTTLSIMRSLPEGDWAVRSENWTLPAEFASHYDRLESAMRAADEVVKTYRNHECDTSGCGKWMPVAPEPPGGKNSQ